MYTGMNKHTRLLEFRGSILKLTELEKTPGMEMAIDQPGATTESRCVFSCCLRVRGRAQQRWKPARRFWDAFLPRRLLLHTKSLQTLCWQQSKPTSDKTKQRSETDYVHLCGFSGISVCKILLSLDAHMTSVSAKPAKFLWMESNTLQTVWLLHFSRSLYQGSFLNGPWKQ